MIAGDSYTPKETGNPEIDRETDKMGKIQVLISVLCICRLFSNLALPI